MQERSRPNKTRNEVRTARTRAALIDAARQLFAEKGFVATGTPEIVKLAGVTRGALYHHFADKNALFQAVVEAESRQVATEISQATASQDSAIQALRDGSKAYFRAMQGPGRVRLLLLDGPSVLGPATMQRIDEEGAGSTLKAGLQEAMAAGELSKVPLDALASALNAAFDRAALDIAGGQNASNSEAAIDAILGGLFR